MDNSDPLGLYRALGLSPTATTDEIAAAFRKRAKETHPDTSGRESAEEFVQVSAAYDVLGDPARREKYDKSTWESFQREASSNDTSTQGSNFTSDSGDKCLDPIRCTRCGKVTAQPRFASFTYLYSFVFFASVNSVGGIFCINCARQERLYCSIITMVAGSWSFPLGPYASASIILENAKEARQASVSDEKRMLHNAWAFFSRGEFKLAYALAEAIKKSKDGPISLGSEVLMNKIENSGVDYHSPELVDPWRRSFMDIILYPIMAVILPVALVGYIGNALYQSPGTTYRNYYDPTGAERHRAYVEHVHTAAPHQSKAVRDLNGESSLPFGIQRWLPVNPISPEIRQWMSTNPTLSKIQQELFPPRSSVCVQRPFAWERGGSNAASGEDYGAEFSNVSNNDVIIKVRDARSRSVVASFFLKSGEHDFMKMLPEGNYIYQEDIGKNLNMDCGYFDNTIYIFERPLPKARKKKYILFGGASVPYIMVGTFDTGYRVKSTIPETPHLPPQTSLNQFQKP